MNQFYITTPLYYVNDQPHIGHAYSTVMADILARYHRLFGDATHFLTGTDEHGLKVQQAAEARGKAPQDHCDEMVQNFKAIWKELHIEYDIFFRTTDSYHVKAVQTCLQQLWDNDEIYAATYEGWYSVSEEIFYTEKELIDGKSPTGREVQKVKEKNYFFKMSNYQQKLIDHINENPTFIQPDSKKNEVLGFLKQPLNDLCISRPKSRLQWGIELPFDAEFVTYVWFDALLNYATGVGFQQSERREEFDKWWNQAGAHHIIGKDILTTHCVYWTTMLLALGARLPEQIFAHGWILNKDSEKMSKSKGDTIKPLDFKDIVGIEPLRYFFARDVHFGNDAPFSQDLLVGRINNDLANNLGNMLSRVSNLINKYFDGKAPGKTADDKESKELQALATETPRKVKTKIEAMAPSYALEEVMNLLDAGNRYLEQKAPWKMAKEDVNAAGEVLQTALECLRVSAILLSPVMPFKMQELLRRISCEGQVFDQACEWGLISASSQITKGEPLFPRIEL